MFVTYFCPENGINADIFESFLSSDIHLTTKKTEGTWKTESHNVILKGIPTNVKIKWALKAQRLAKEAATINRTTPAQERFRVYYIPKKSGGQRKIEEPVPVVMEFLDKVKRFLETDMKFHAHPSSFAYVKQKNTLDAVKVHQKAQNRWFLKLDFHNFFGSITKDLLMTSFWNIYPFIKMKDWCSFEKDMADIFSIAFAADGHLPQGTPLSPTISNICMLESDFAISESCKSRNITYTRYADDLLFSSKDRQSLEKIVSWVNRVTPRQFKLNREKTRFGSIAGSNWNLGLMLNKDNNITVGKKKKDVMRATLFTYAMKIKNHEIISLSEKLSFEGLYNYYHYVEPVYFDQLVDKMIRKTGVNLFQCFDLTH